MNAIVLLLATRYFWKRKKESTISLMMIISSISIFVGAFALALVTAIMNGFEYTIHKKIQNIHPAATIYSHINPISVDAVQNLIINEFPEILTISPQAIGHVLIYAHDQENNQPVVAMLKGIDPKKEAGVSAIGSKFSSLLPIDQAIHTNTIALGKELANQLGISVGATLPLFYFEQRSTNRRVMIEQKEVIVGGIFETGIDEYDNSIIYCALPFFETLFPDQGITQLGLSFKPNSDIPALVTKLKETLELEVYTWQELYPSLIAALTLEKYAMFFILLLITLVASMNIIALIFMLISYKKSDIAILRALGMSARYIQYLFIIIGMLLSCIASIFGLIGAWIAAIILEKYPFIQLPDVYYVSQLPSHMTISITGIVFILILIVTFIASWFATRRIASMNISQVLRFEG